MSWFEKQKIRTFKTPALTEDERKRAIIAGLEKIGKRQKKAGDPEAATTLDAATKAAETVKAYDTITAEMQAQCRIDPIGDAADVAARKLLKVLGTDCLADMAEARKCALRLLPLKAAHAASSQAIAAGNKLSTERKRLGLQFWDEVNRGIRATDLPHDDSAIELLAKMGM